jgi:hypothetical protein
VLRAVLLHRPSYVVRLLELSLLVAANEPLVAAGIDALAS